MTFPELLLWFAPFGSLISFIGTAYAIWEIATKPFKEDKKKGLWVVFVLVFNLIGAIIYFVNREDLLADPAEKDREYLPPLDDENWKREPVARPLTDDDLYV